MFFFLYMLRVKRIKFPYVKLNLGYLFFTFLFLGWIILCQNATRFFQGTVMRIKELLGALDIFILKLLQLWRRFAEKHRILISQLVIHATLYSYRLFGLLHVEHLIIISILRGFLYRYLFFEYKLIIVILCFKIKRLLLLFALGLLFLLLQGDQ